MKLTDVVSYLHLPVFAEVPLVIFLGIFIGVALHLMSRKEELKQFAALPLRDEPSSRRAP
jgi:hypothetical protein